jgi:general stress protein 26
MIHLRYLVTETEKEYNTSWLSSNKKQTYIERSKEVLQYSLDGVEWMKVPTVIERVKGD